MKDLTLKELRALAKANGIKHSSSGHRLYLGQYRMGIDYEETSRIVVYKLDDDGHVTRVTRRDVLRLAVAFNGNALAANGNPPEGDGEKR